MTVHCTRSASATPTKAQKQHGQKKLSDRYNSVPVPTEQLPEGWTPDAVMVDATYAYNKHDSSQTHTKILVHMLQPFL